MWPFITTVEGTAWIAELLLILTFFFICIPPVRFTVSEIELLLNPEVIGTEVEVEVEPNPKPIEVTPSLLAAGPAEEEAEEEEEVAPCSAFSNDWQSYLQEEKRKVKSSHEGYISTLLGIELFWDYKTRKEKK